MLETGSGNLTLQAVFGPTEASEKARNVGQLKAVEHAGSINMQVATTGKPIICPDVSQEPGFVPIYEAARSSVTVPLKYQDRVIGTLNVECARRNAFTHYDCTLLDSFSDQAAVAIMNARLYDARRQDIAALQAINEAATSLPLSEVLQLIVDMVVTVVPSEHSELWLKRANSGDLILESVCKCSARQLAEETGNVVAEAQSVYAKVATTHQPQVGDYSATVPLLYQAKTIGVLHVESSLPSSFFESSIALLQSLANQASTAIESARRIQELEMLEHDRGRIR